MHLPNDVDELTAPCPKCNASCFRKGYSSTYCGYISPPGHDHDNNERDFEMKCVCGNEFSVRVINTCPNHNCDWEGKKGIVESLTAEQWAALERGETISYDIEED